jgi:hypothetical protein
MVGSAADGGAALDPLAFGDRFVAGAPEDLAGAGPDAREDADAGGGEEPPAGLEPAFGEAADGESADE